MRVVALLTVRNEELFLARCLEHLYSQGIETCIIDNGSTDKTMEIAQSFFGKGVFRIESLPYNGKFELYSILSYEEKLASKIDADWFIHHDADEIREAPPKYKNMVDAIADADSLGYNAINFNEFVFLPTSENESYENTDYVKEMKYYYFFEPHPLRRINAWKKSLSMIDLKSSGGHEVKLPERNIFPQNFILRHYIVLSKMHAISKYAGRTYSMSEVSNLGWHGSRTAFKADSLKFTEKENLIELRNDDLWNTDNPWKKHEFLGDYTMPTNFTVPNENIVVNNKTKKAFIYRLFKKNNEINPVPFIVGVGRSGTTLLRLMLDANPQMAIPPETHFIPNLLNLSETGDELCESFFNIITTTNRWNDFHISKEKFYRALKLIKPFTIAEGLRCFYRIYSKKFNKCRWGEKTPSYGLNMKSIQQVLPEAYFIHIIRDGRDVALSLKDLWFGPGKEIEAQASDWLWKIREIRQQSQCCHHYLEIKYEDLILNTNSVVQQICDFINLPYSDRMLEYYIDAQKRLNEFENKISHQGKLVTKEEIISIHKNTLTPPNKNLINKWKVMMSEEDRNIFEKIAGSMLRDLGYETN